MRGLIPYTIWPHCEDPETQPETSADSPGAGADRGAPYDILLGYRAGVPVRALAAWDGAAMRIVRLVTTDPSLYLEPALAPGSPLGVAWPEFLQVARLPGSWGASQSRA